MHVSDTEFFEVVDAGLLAVERAYAFFGESEEFTLVGDA